MDFNEFNLETVSIEESELDRLLNGLPEATPSADNLKIGKEAPPTEEPKATVIPAVEDGAHDLDDILNGETIEDADEDDDKKPTEEKKKEEVVEPKAAESKKEKKVAPAAPAAKKETELNEDALKQITDFYIEQGYWKDFDGRDEIEYNAETFQDLLVKQNEEIAAEKFNELLDSAGPVGKKIIDHVVKGGKPDDIIDLFKEQKANLEFEAESVDDKKNFIAQYYKEVHGFSDEKIKRIVNAAEVDDTIDDEISEIKTSYEKYYSKELQRIEEEREQHVARQKENEEKFQNEITSEIFSRNIPEKDKKYLKDIILNYDQKLPDGTRVSKFYLKFAEMQNNTKDYIDFVEFVTNKEKFIDKIRKTEETKATEKAFFKIKKNESVGNKTGSGHMSVSKDDIEDFKFF